MIHYDGPWWDRGASFRAYGVAGWAPYQSGARTTPVFGRRVSGGEKLGCDERLFRRRSTVGGCYTAASGSE
jgi:hypothetical protein